MREITLSEFLKNDHTHQDAANVIGCTPGAVWQMIRDERDIRFRLNSKGVPVEAYEIKPLKRA